MQRPVLPAKQKKDFNTEDTEKSEEENIGSCFFSVLSVSAVVKN